MTEVQELKQQVADLSSKFKALDNEIHTIKHNSANIANQIGSIHKVLERLETTLMKYDGNKAIGFEGKFQELEDKLEDLKKQNSILMDAYEIGKTWKIKLSGFFLALATLSTLVAATFGIAKALYWIYEHLQPSK